MLLCLLFLSCIYVFFFFKQKTAYEMRIRDWSSDVCSSDLVDRLCHLAAPASVPPFAVVLRRSCAATDMLLLAKPQFISRSASSRRAFALGKPATTMIRRRPPRFAEPRKQ